MAASSSSASARRAARTAAATRSGSGSGDSVSAALLWTLRADPAVAESATSALSSPSPKITKTATSLESTRRGPGRPKKADANAKSAAKWDDTVTSLLLQFRYVSMRGAFEGVRNNVEVGECWIQLANEISRLSGKSFDSHQCQSKLRNLKKTWREITKGTKTATVSPLHALLGKYLGRGDDNSAARTAAERSDSNADASGGEHDDLRSGPAFGDSRILSRSDSLSSDDKDDEDEDDDKDAVASAGDKDEQEHERDDADDGAQSSPRADDEEESVQQQEEQDDTTASDARGADDSVETDAAVVIAAVDHSSGARRSRSNSDDSRASKRPKTGAVPSPPSTPSLLVDTEAVVAPAVRAIASTSSPDARIDASLLSVASGLRAMVEGVVAANEATSEQTLILSELREHNALMKRYCDEVSKQTASLNALIELLAAKFSK